MEFGAMTNEGLIKIHIKDWVDIEEGMTLTYKVATMATDEVYNWAAWEPYEGMIPFRILEVYRTPTQWDITESDKDIGSILR